MYEVFDSRGAAWRLVRQKAKDDLEQVSRYMRQRMAVENVVYIPFSEIQKGTGITRGRLHNVANMFPRSIKRSKWNKHIYWALGMGLEVVSCS